MANVMIIDDLQYSNNLHYKELSRDGHTLAYCEDDDAVIEQLSKKKIDIVLLDIYHKGYEDWRILRMVKKIYPLLPVIIFTAYTIFLKKHQLLDADGYIIKSIDNDKLKRKVREVIGKKIH